MELEDFVAKLEGVRRMPSGISARCPAHEDHVASLSVNNGRDGGVVVTCHANCRTEDVVAALGLRMRDLAGAPHVTDTYLYTDDHGAPLYKILRWANPKRFELVPAGIPPAQRVLYRSDALAWARERGAIVYVVEGEKDANRLAELGLVSTTNPFGAGSWEAHYSAQLAGCQVIVVADNDVAGHNHAREVGESVRPLAASVALTRCRHGNDVSEMLDFGLSLDALEPLPEAGAMGVILAADVLVRPIRWAWPAYIPLGKVSAFEGDPGDGKSILTVDLAARWSSGMAMPDGQKHDGPWPVIMINAEDDPEDTVTPRLMAAGGNLKLIRFVDYGSDPNKPFDITADMSMLTRLVIDTGAKIVMVDPLSAFLGEAIDSHNDASTRRGLFPLYRMARTTGAAVVVVRHLNKGQGGKAIYRGGGSIAFSGAARAVYAVGRDPEDRTRRVVACTKINIAPEPPALAYSISSGSAGPYLEWHGIVDVDAQAVLDGIVAPDVEEIIQFLNTVVQNGEPMRWAAISEAGQALGFSDKQLVYRRPQSKLIKIVGSEGRRSTRWGYREHLLRSKAPSDQGGPSDAKNPHVIKTKGPVDEGYDPSEGQEPASPGSLSQGYEGEWESMGSFGLMGLDQDPMTEEERRDLELDALPLVCQECGTDKDVGRFGAPNWVVRCLSHSPYYFRDGS